MGDAPSEPDLGFAKDDVAHVSRPIRLDRENGRISIDAEGGHAIVEFRIRGHVLSVLHTETPAHLAGRGFATAMARASLEWARAEGLTVKPYCPFTAGFIHRHPEFRDLVDPEFARGRQV